MNRCLPSLLSLETFELFLKGIVEQRKSKIYDQKIRPSNNFNWHFLCASRRIHVYVDDVNEFIPLWSEQEYNGQLEEGDLSSFILQVEKIITKTDSCIILDVPRLRPLTMTARPAMAMSANIPFPVQRTRRCSQWTSRASSPTPSPFGPGLCCVSR